MSDMPEDVRRAVIAEVYRQADDMDWDGLTDRQHTTIYDRWLDDPTIGQQLTRFLSRERARVWLKDVPMKEYARARYGIGPYAALAASRFPSVGQIARQVLGVGWDAVDGTIAEKPNRCVVTNGQEERLMMWGPPKTLRDIVWAGINARADDDPTPILVVAVQHGQILNDGEKRRHAQLAGYAGLEVRHAVLRATRVAPAKSPESP